MFFNGLLGIGASAYYRRIVEELKDTLLERVDRCLESIPEAADYQELRAKIDAARSQNQFATAVEELNRTIPPFLSHKGQNLLALLHAGLSKDLHGSSDEAVLEDARHIRRILEEVAKRIAAALAADTDLDDAVKALAAKAATKRTTS